MIAGNRSFPLYVARAARREGYRVVAAGLREETDPALEGEVDAMHWLTLSDLSRLPALLKEAGVREVILAGQIRPERLLKEAHRLDGTARALLKAAPDRSGSSAMALGVRFLQAQGFRVLHSGRFLGDWIPARGVLTRRAPTEEERRDLKTGLRLARKLDRLRIGQTLVLKQGAVAAVEALEGTDAAVRRAGRLAGPGCVVVKACGPRHDMRFDIPVVGAETLAALQEARASCLGVEAGRTLLFERERLIAQADEKNLTVVAL